MKRVVFFTLILAAVVAAPANACSVKIAGVKCVEAISAGSKRAEGAKWLRVPVAPPPVSIGDILPPDYMMLMNTAYYGLPPVGNGWRYYRVERDVFRVDNKTREVLERVTDRTNRAFR